jgi:hypothetical protein
MAAVDIAKFKAGKTEKRYELKVKISHEGGGARIKKIGARKKDKLTAFTDSEVEEMITFLECAMQLSEDHCVLTCFNKHEEGFVRRILTPAAVADKLKTNKMAVHKMIDPVPDKGCLWQEKIWLKFFGKLPERASVGKFVRGCLAPNSKMSDAYRQLEEAAAQKKEEEARHTPHKTKDYGGQNVHRAHANLSLESDRRGKHDRKGYDRWGDAPPWHDSSYRREADYHTPRRGKGGSPEYRHDPGYQTPRRGAGGSQESFTQSREQDNFVKRGRQDAQYEAGVSDRYDDRTSKKYRYEDDRSSKVDEMCRW